ncbi:ABC transporter ATP-binding protein [Biformimicrobium ophioploci]|uniref:ATP-binding cassette domain-containing protein n=1 Tax=Biformimicrobium ophioploci TaxID=3036711 RepID=A0ABQ6M2U7_9GAMM|nr:ATP-binding cassette domain-containing protein [Microbulbifer sp. NKW57]GMG88665.1 ATP-binding cassette domain-containing protein [Microbulbifer sp. NKW57]
MIKVRGLKKSFANTAVLRGINFDVPDGKITTLLGANGAGKTTCLRILTGLMTPEGGTVHFDALEIQKETQQIRRRLGVISDREGLYERLTVAEYLDIFASMQGLGGEAKAEALASVRDSLGLDGLWSRRMKGFSQGERMKVSLARALVHKPHYLVLDEPTRGLDVLAVRLLRKTLNELRDQGCAILFSSHVMQEVEELSDQVLVMSAGRIVASGTPGGLKQQCAAASLEDAFVEFAYGSEARDKRAEESPA